LTDPAPSVAADMKNAARPARISTSSRATLFQRELKKSNDLSPADCSVADEQAVRWDGGGALLLLLRGLRLSCVNSLN